MIYNVSTLHLDTNRMKGCLQVMMLLMVKLMVMLLTASAVV